MRKFPKTMRKNPYDGYWKRRKESKYYKKLLEYINLYSPGESILDVGCADTPIATWGEFEHRFTCDIEFDPKLPGVESTIQDFMEYSPPLSPVSVVVCAQTIEHLPDDIIFDFAQKLLSTGEMVVVSVPYLWREEWEKQHLQDPITLPKFFNIMGGKPVRYAVVEDKRDRLVALYNGVS